MSNAAYYIGSNSVSFRLQTKTRGTRPDFAMGPKEKNGTEEKADPRAKGEKGDDFARIHFRGFPVSPPLSLVSPFKLCLVSRTLFRHSSALSSEARTWKGSFLREDYSCLQSFRFCVDGHIKNDLNVFVCGNINCLLFAYTILHVMHVWIYMRFDSSTIIVKIQIYKETLLHLETSIECLSQVPPIFRVNTFRLVRNFKKCDMTANNYLLTIKYRNAQNW